MNRYVLTLVASALFCMLGCGTKTPTKTADGQNDTATIQLNWSAESEHGGVYQAFADGLYQDAKIAVTINPGGKKAPIGAELQLERAQFAIANADDVVTLRDGGADIVAVLAAMQNHPRCIMVRADSGIESLNNLAGKTFQCRPRPFVEFMRSKGLLKDVQEVPYHASVAQLVADKNVIIQAYSFSEPLLAKEQGVDVRALMVSEIGYNPYSSVLVTTGKLIRERPEYVKRFVDATRQGWRNYLTSPAAGNKEILVANSQMTSQTLERGMDELRSLARPDDLSLDDVGMMTTERWTTLVTQLQDLGIVKSDKVKAEDCFTLEFIH